MDLQLKAGENATHLHTSALPRNDKMGIMPYDDKAGNAKLIKLQHTQKD